MTWPSASMSTRSGSASTSRLVVQTSEDAREISVKHMDDERAAAGRDADANRVASANAEARSANARSRQREGSGRDANRERDECRTQDLTTPRIPLVNAAAGQAQAERDAAARTAAANRPRRAESDQQPRPPQ